MAMASYGSCRCWLEMSEKCAVETVRRCRCWLEMAEQCAVEIVRCTCYRWSNSVNDMNERIFFYSDRHEGLGTLLRMVWLNGSWRVAWNGNY